ncbi:prepilin-type N-terminal cleavage/methylation domain-containing protein [Proteiniclasticum sp. SCR006]|uniref:Prepilin-type N-terminal cleavage/methylation domain-containing protein n=1 Tax=Proteiniclasticum aestuarii TaxID=2817862 RepID=A0A939HBC4_9CLOT|nr:prepilin-type N-terminal cleavage/methylation domain-containing protein [Proteiniclasticum aestuarii]MBO1266029.1 prepilin-type N-terminal cleavage/methylation domain-containing protein [Proteiniclasticum aestuarii]
MNNKSVKNQGFSLLEVLIAMALVALIAVVSIPLFSFGQVKVKQGGDDSTQLFLAESRIETDDENISSYEQGQLMLNFEGEVIEVNIEIYKVTEGDISIRFFEYQK